jgi:hypothetical protein
MVFEILHNRDVGGVLGLHLHQDDGEVNTLKADRVDVVRIGEGANNIDHALEGLVADGDLDDRLMLKVEPIQRILLAF